MEYIKPKKADKLSVTWRVSSQTKSAVKYYAQYTGYTEHEVVDMVLGQLKDDPNFY